MNIAVMPDVSGRPHECALSRSMSADPDTLYRAWTEQLDRWFASRASVHMEPRVGSPFFFETVHGFDEDKPAERRPCYGRFLRLEPGRLIEMSWVTGSSGTEGAETIVTMEFSKRSRGSRLKLVHKGFPSQESAAKHEALWPLILDHLDRCMEGVGPGEAAPRPHLAGGRNIAMKLPVHQYEETVRFYRDVLGMEQIEELLPAIGFRFGANQLWLDQTPGMSQAELWLEIVTDDTKAAAELMAAEGIARCDAIEPLGENFDGFWISSPAQIIHLVDHKSGAW